MAIVPLVGACLLAVVPSGVPELCFQPADCGAESACVQGRCRQGAARSTVRLLHTLAVPDPLPLSRSEWLEDESRIVGRMMRESLRWTGFYETLSEMAFPDGWELEGVSPSETDRGRWSDAGAYRVVRSTLQPTGDPGTYILRVRVVELEQHDVVDLRAGDVVVRPGGRWNAVAAWVDALVGHDTGLAGALGTRIVATFRSAPGVKEVALLDPIGGDPVFVTRNGSLNLTPSWGPGGTIGYMSYITGNTDWLVDGVPVSTRPGLNAAGTWSPDGRWLALSVAEDENSEVVIVDWSTGRVHKQVTDHPAVDTSPAWSPDGKRLAFVSDRSGNPQVWVVELDSGTLTRVTRGGYITSPTWSPLGDRLIYSQLVGPERYVL
ncbi:MAG: LpqB family beta-propeller domain-containing protein, partial [Myxococcota bacterium]|nr:LpqB family beta-propeller domain-containing protein [Myxococcota bacterium]